MTSTTATSSPASRTRSGRGSVPLAGPMGVMLVRINPASAANAADPPSILRLIVDIVSSPSLR